MADLDAIRAAAAKVRAITWTHGDDCPHRYCDEPDDCADGDGVAIVGDGVHCESPGVPCDCYVDVIAQLLGAIGAPPAPHPFASLLADPYRLAAIAYGMSHLDPATIARVAIVDGREVTVHATCAERERLEIKEGAHLAERAAKV